jgi:rSAM/selenodomain-associated transferase 2
MNSISIIIPVLNEAENISKLLQHLALQSTTNIIEEIIIVDGGSSDSTIEIVKKIIASSDSDQESEVYREVENQQVFDSSLKQGRSTFSQSENTRTDIRLLVSKKGRAIQLNHGAKYAKGSTLYFLHADSFPPNGFDRLIFQEIENGNQAGCFKMKFDTKHWWLQLAGWFTKFNWKACRGGDQSLFITKKLFKNLNGFNESYSIYEDVDFINKLYSKNQFSVIQQPIITSARRYRENGISTLQFHFWMIYLKKFLGASADNLYAYYNKHIS